MMASTIVRSPVTLASTCNLSQKRKAGVGGSHKKLDLFHPVSSAHQSVTATFRQNSTWKGRLCLKVVVAATSPLTDGWADSAAAPPVNCRRTLTKSCSALLGFHGFVLHLPLAPKHLRSSRVTVTLAQTRQMVNWGSDQDRWGERIFAKRAFPMMASTIVRSPVTLASTCNLSQKRKAGVGGSHKKLDLFHPVSSAHQSVTATFRQN